MKRSHLVFALLILLALILGITNNAAAQNTATLSGVITDPQGGSVSDAKVTLISKSTGAVRSCHAASLVVAVRSLIAGAGANARGRRLGELAP